MRAFVRFGVRRNARSVFLQPTVNRLAGVQPLTMPNFPLAYPQTMPWRGFAKSGNRGSKETKKPKKNKNKKKGGKGGSSYDNDLFDLSSDELQMQRWVDKFRETVDDIRVGRASPDALDYIVVLIGEEKVDLPDLCSVSSRSARSLMVAVHDPAHIDVVDKAISGSKLELSTSVLQNGMVVNFPKITGEVRNELSRTLAKKLEAQRGALRNVRQGAMTRLKKSDLSNDEQHVVKDGVTELLDKYMDQLEEMASEKEDEINAN